jgi:hypothetical protein
MRRILAVAAISPFVRCSYTIRVQAQKCGPISGLFRSGNQGEGDRMRTQVWMRGGYRTKPGA